MSNWPGLEGISLTSQDFETRSKMLNARNMNMSNYTRGVRLIPGLHQLF